MVWGKQVCAKFKKSLGKEDQGGTRRKGVDRRWGVKRVGNTETVASSYTCLTKICAGRCSLSYFIKSFLISVSYHSLPCL